MCDHCGIIFMREPDVLPAIAESVRKRGNALIDQDVLLLGVVDRVAFSRRLMGNSPRCDGLYHVATFIRRTTTPSSPISTIVNPALSCTNRR